LFGAADAAKRFAWRARACPRPAWNKNAEVMHQRPPPAANRRKNGPPTPRGRKRPLRWDGTPSLSATPGERFTENGGETDLAAERYAYRPDIRRFVVGWRALRHEARLGARIVN